MRRAWRYRARAALITIPVAAGLTLAADVPAAADLDYNFECNQVFYHSFLIDKPLNGFSCTGEAGVRGSTILDVPRGNAYYCRTVRISDLGDEPHVSGQLCEPV
ncbi:hypothetical protein [Amycolatopsis aidingensis]|uniref:hypothetical protein n=1 Tax=Amycolatopsis aidingensis TaxID=2842453 RepID=UPI001C0D8CF0|nr:hypothetical protein [Amycolatopsis aidingensis]